MRYSPENCRRTSWLSARISTSSAPDERARSSAARKPRHSATLFVAVPSALESVRPEGDQTPYEAGPGFRATPRRSRGRGGRRVVLRRRPVCFAGTGRAPAAGFPLLKSRSSRGCACSSRRSRFPPRAGGPTGAGGAGARDRPSTRRSGARPCRRFATAIARTLVPERSKVAAEEPWFELGSRSGFRASPRPRDLGVRADGLLGAPLLHLLFVARLFRRERLVPAVELRGGARDRCSSRERISSSRVLTSRFTTSISFRRAPYSRFVFTVWSCP